MSKLEKLSFNDVLKWHALAAGPAGLVLVMLPHRLFAQLSGAPYSPRAHEVARCYGALTAAQACSPGARGASPTAACAECSRRRTRSATR